MESAKMTLSPKRLSFREMWKLYQYLKLGLDTEQEFLIDEISYILEHVTKEDYLLSLSLLYDDKIEYAKLGSVDSIIMFMDGLESNNFFDFCTAIRGIAR